jgi:Ser/Thr protein kinase RdoA (MazF antagonist)
MIGARIGAGREADVHAWGGDAVIKLYRPGFGGHRAEALALATLDSHSVAPRLIDTVERDGRTGLVLERLAGSDMLSLLQRHPWRLLGLARALAGAHHAVHQIQAPAALPDLRPVLAARIQDAVMPPRLRGYVSRLLDQLPDGDRLCHGDYHPGNVLITADRVAIIDWANATRGAPQADHARTMLLLRWADPLPGTPLASRALMAAGRSLFTHGYARAYRADSPQVDSWLIVNAAARLAEGIEIEQATLIGLLDRAQRGYLISPGRRQVAANRSARRRHRRPWPPGG